MREREFALLFSATVLTSLGSIVGTIALVFAVLDVAGPTSLGVVIAAREVASAAVRPGPMLLPACPRRA